MTQLISSFTLSVAHNRFSCKILFGVSSTREKTTYTEQDITEQDTVLFILGDKRMSVTTLETINNVTDQKLHKESTGHSRRFTCDICNLQTDKGFSFNHFKPSGIRATTTELSPDENIILSEEDDKKSEGITHCVPCAIDFRENIIHAIENNETVRSAIFAKHI